MREEGWTDAIDFFDHYFLPPSTEEINPKEVVDLDLDLDLVMLW